MDKHMIKTREGILNEAKNCICGKREQEYGNPENNFATIAKFWSIYLAASHPESLSSIPITAKDVAIMMSLLKIARIAAGNNPDSFVDLAGYAACAGEIADQTVEEDIPEKWRAVYNSFLKADEKI